MSVSVRAKPKPSACPAFTASAAAACDDHVSHALLRAMQDGDSDWNGGLVHLSLPFFVQRNTTQCRIAQSGESAVGSAAMSPL